MSYSLTRTELQQVRLQTQRLRTPEAKSPAALVANLVAVQSQEKPSSLLVVRPRCSDISKKEVLDALDASRQIIRTWCLRGTLHLVAAEDLGWMLDLVGTRLVDNRQRRYRQLELDPRTLSLATASLTEYLKENGPMTRAEIASHFESRGISAEGQRTPHILGRAALLGLICLGPDRENGKETYVLLEDWVNPDAPKAQGDWDTLAYRYLRGYGPASVDDFATWSGARKQEAREAFDAQQRLKIEYESETLWMLEEQAPLLEAAFVPSVHLLPAYDPLLLGYRARSWMVRPEHARKIHPGGGFLRPVVLVNGEAAGTWQLARQGQGYLVKVNPFFGLEKHTLQQVEAEVTEIGRFLGVDTEIRIL